MSTALEILAPFLPYGIDVASQWTDGSDNKTGLLLGVNISHERPVIWFDGGIKYESSYANVLPVLRSFADLCTPLADGTVPAMEVAKLAVWVPAELDQPKYLWQHSGAEHDEDEYGNEYVAVRICKSGAGHNANDLLYIFSHWDIVTPNGFSNQLPVIDYLRRNHFAVGLAPNQFIRKTE